LPTARVVAAFLIIVAFMATLIGLAVRAVHGRLLVMSKIILRLACTVILA